MCIGKQNSSIQPGYKKRFDKPHNSKKIALVNCLVRDMIKKGIGASNSKQTGAGKGTPAQSPRNSNNTHAQIKNTIKAPEQKIERNIPKGSSITAKNSIDNPFSSRKMSHDSDNKKENIKITISKAIVRRTPSLSSQNSKEKLNPKAEIEENKSKEEIKSKHTADKLIPTISGTNQSLSTGEYTCSFAIKLNDPISKERERLIQSNKLCIKQF